MSSTLNALRGNHLPYERQRILDGIPQLKHKLDSTPPSKDKLDCDLINKYFNVYHAVKTTGSITLTHRDGASHAGPGQTYREGCEPTLYCINHGRVNAWRGAGNVHLMQIWECEVDASARYVIESLAVNIKDQGWGNTGANIALFAVIGDYMMEVASRALQDGERRLDALDLIKEGFNFSRFMFSSFLPPGTSKVALVAMGRLKDAGHQFNYSGHSLKLGVLA